MDKFSINKYWSETGALAILPVIELNIERNNYFVAVSLEFKWLSRWTAVEVVYRKPK